MNPISYIDLTGIELSWNRVQESLCGEKFFVGDRWRSSALCDGIWSRGSNTKQRGK